MAKTTAYPIIPLPGRVDLGDGEFLLNKDNVIVVDDANQWNASYLQRAIQDQTQFRLSVVPFPAIAGPRIQLVIEDSLESNPEGYQLTVSNTGVLISAKTEIGCFYGIQTLRQLLPVKIKTKGSEAASIPCMAIQDRPCFTWRGLMLDEGRYFHGKATVLRLLDVMALLKMNVFHWHLTEDQGWRLEIKKYPKLTEIGSRGPGTAQTITQTIRNQHDNVSQSGFYTQEEIREIIAYAQERHILVVPEIEMPGHSTAALAAYPELGCTGKQTSPGTRFGIFKDVFCPGKERTFTFIEDVLLEVMALFPSPYIHIGGDEAPRSRWKKCPRCQERIAREGLQNEHQLQEYFTNRIAGFLENHNRQLVGWNEILSDNLHRNAVAQYWVGSRKSLLEGMHQGRKVIISSYLNYYLDHSYWLTPLSKSYNFYPEFPELTDAETGNLLGVEAPLWSEFVPDWARLEYQTFPRLLAVAETGWTSKSQKNYADFFARYNHFKSHLKAMGIRCPKDEEVEPSRIQQAFGVFTIILPQRKTCEH